VGDSVDRAATLAAMRTVAVSNGADDERTLVSSNISAEAELTTGALVSIRGQKWVVSDIDPADSSTLVALQSVDEGRFGETLEVIWEVEPGRQVLPSGSLPTVTTKGFDPPEQLAAFLDAVRWSAVTSADVGTPTGSNLVRFARPPPVLSVWP
jgi:hypothetical protein